MKVSKSLKAKGHSLAHAQKQLELLNDSGFSFNKKGNNFEEFLRSQDLFPLKPRAIDTLQINLGKMCNQTCEHCHVDAGPDRKEIMTKETMQECLIALKGSKIKTVDLTGGAPEMNPNFRWFVGQLFELGIHIIVRSNLTIIKANKKYHDLPQFFKSHRIEVVSSLPCYTKENVDKQRGDGVFNNSIEALKDLNQIGYGIEEGLILNLVFNPGGPSIAPDQKTLEGDYKKRLKEDFGIVFSSLYTITNLPISRFLEFLQAVGKTEEYMNKLIESYNPIAVENVMCRNLISVSWEGNLFDCDFNQMLEISIDKSTSQHIRDFNAENLEQRTIAINQHCFGCAAGSGSSCSGSLA